MTTSSGIPAARTIGWTFLTALAPAVWGTTYLTTTELLPAGHPMFAALLRSLPAGLLALLLLRQLPRGAWWWKAAVLGALNIGIFLPLLFITAQRLPGGVAATLGAIQPLLVVLLATGILAQRLSLRALLWGALGVIGVALVVLQPGAGLDPLGVLTGLGGAASMATGMVLAKRWGRPEGVSPVAFAGWQLTAGGILLIVPGLLVDGVPARIDGPALLGYAWLGLVGGLAAYALWFAGVRVLPVTSIALLGLLSPLVATGLGVLALGETWTPWQLLGLVIALAALVAGQLPDRSQGPTRPAAPAVPSPPAASRLGRARSDGVAPDGVAPDGVASDGVTSR